MPEDVRMAAVALGPTEVAVPGVAVPAAQPAGARPTAAAAAAHHAPIRRLAPTSRTGTLSAVAEFDGAACAHDIG